ncbi:MAG: hypothetical protein NTV49_05410 [Kiritimatiellaeota bacterium]|nr:hypothetical protein [Kiritimatiellota bacterium]
MQFPKYPARGEPLSESWGRQLLDYLRSITPQSSPTVRVSIGAGGATFQAEAAPAARRQPAACWSGDCWIAGVLYSGKATDAAKEWIRIDLSTTPYPTITEEAGPPPSPWGQGAIWRRKSDQTTLYIDRLG